MGKVYEKELEFVCNFYGDDFNRLELEAQLKVLRTLYSDKYEDDEQASVRSLKAVLQDLSLPQRSLIDEVCLVFKLLLVMPATNCTSERSFSALRRIKTYLRSTMTQARLNHLMIINYHQDLTDKMDLEVIADEFIDAKESRSPI